MATLLTRAQLLRGDFRGTRQPLRPPWALPEAAFVQRCSRCGRCADHCPGHLLEQGRGGFPVVNFRRGECTFCRACLAHCPEGALQEMAGQGPWHLVARVAAHCLAPQGVVCRTCAERCPLRAIRLRPALGRAPVPQVDGDTCNGCGACYGACPVDAIVMGQAPAGGTPL